VRICKEAKPTLPKRDFVLDCANFPDRLQKFHLFFIANSKVFVGTPSGPYNYPRIFGTPSLVANMTNIGRACFPSSSYQEYLPMRFYRDTRELSLAKLLESPAGWADCSERDLANLNLQPIPNTPREIMEAFVHLLDRVESKQVFEESHLQIRARELRSKFTWTSTGNISETFLRDNQNWLI
jgi:putative glycosyltransferase (TIGR04372 family)